MIWYDSPLELSYYIYGGIMKSKFIGAKKLILFKAYSRSDVGYRGTRLALMQINEHEKIGLFCYGEKYDNMLTKKGFILNPREDLNNDRFVSELNRCTTHIFLRNGNFGPYYYFGTSDYASRLDKTHLLLKLNTTEIPVDIYKKFRII